jgi:hypothetical protein
MNHKLALACIPPLLVALFGATSETHAAGPAKLTACSLITDADVKEFAMGKYERKSDPDSCHITVFNEDGGIYIRYLYLTVLKLPPDIKDPNFAKDSVSQSFKNDQQDGGKPLKCSIAGATHYACLDVASPAGSFKPGQRAARVMLGKGTTKVELTVFHDKRPNLDVAKELAEKVFKRMP